MLISRLDATVCAYTLGRMQVAARERGETGAVRCVEWENVRALYAPSIPNPAFNTVTISGPARLEDVEGALDGYRDADAATRIQVVPGALSAELAALLSGRGFRQTGLSSMPEWRHWSRRSSPAGSACRVGRCTWR